MDLKTLNGKRVTILNVASFEVKKVILCGSTKRWLRFREYNEKKVSAELKQTHVVFLESDFEKVKEVVANYKKAKEDYMALEVIRVS